MEKFLRKYYYVFVFGCLLFIALLPTLLLGIINRVLIDFGFLLTAILLVILVLPIFSFLKKNTERRKDFVETTKKVS
jgi:hypothetical protein